MKKYFTKHEWVGFQSFIFLIENNKNHVRFSSDFIGRIDKAFMDKRESHKALISTLHGQIKEEIHLQRRQSLSLSICLTLDRKTI
jgi:hypothetical protein